MSTNSLPKKNINYDLKTLQRTVKNLGQNLNLNSNNSSTGEQKTTNNSTPKQQQKTNNSSTPKQQQKTTNSSTSQQQQKTNNSSTSQQQQKTTNNSTLENPHHQIEKVKTKHKELSDEVEKKEGLLNDTQKYIEGNPNLSDSDKTDLKDDHKSMRHYLDTTKTHLNSAKKMVTNYPIAGLHLKNASKNLGDFHKSMMGHINKFGDTLTTNSKLVINNTKNTLKNRLAATRTNQSTTQKNKNQSTTQKQ